MIINIYLYDGTFKAEIEISDADPRRWSELLDSPHALTRESALTYCRAYLIKCLELPFSDSSLPAAGGLTKPSGAGFLCPECDGSGFIRYWNNRTEDLEIDHICPCGGSDK